MIIVKLDGGLGNQMFQSAFGRYLSMKLRAPLKLDLDRYLDNKTRRYSLDHFNVEPNFSTRPEKKTLKRLDYISSKLKKIGIPIQPYWYSEEFPGYHESVQQLTDPVYLEGFWQSEKYFKPVEEAIRRELVVKNTPDPINASWLERIKQATSVSIHVRRGDYVSDAATNAIHGVCDTDYYREAVSRISREVLNPSFFIFSDDISWTRENLLIEGYSVSYVDHNAKADHEDMRLMYSCKHHIIANSSFSWWGAWLNNSAVKKVVAPKKWFRTLENKDIIPEGWLAI